MYLLITYQRFAGKHDKKNYDFIEIERRSTVVLIVTAFIVLPVFNSVFVISIAFCYKQHAIKKSVFIRCH